MTTNIQTGKSAHGVLAYIAIHNPSELWGSDDAAAKLRLDLAVAHFEAGGEGNLSFGVGMVAGPKLIAYVTTSPWSNEFVIGG